MELHDVSVWLDVVVLDSVTSPAAILDAIFDDLLQLADDLWQLEQGELWSEEESADLAEEQTYIS